MPGGCEYLGIWALGNAGTEALGGGLCLCVPPDLEGTQPGGPGGRPGVLSPHQRGVPG